MKPLCFSNFVKTVGVICAFLMPLAVSAHVSINETNFPDANFRSFVKSNYGYNGGNTIMESTIESITSMDCSNKSIKNLKGIEFFTNLKTLSCSSNQLEYLNVSALTELESLSCNNNKLYSLSVSGNIKLKSLKCQNNQLRALYIGPYVSKLTSVYCYNNQMNYSAVRRLASTLPSFSGSGSHMIYLYGTSSEKNCIVANSWFSTGWTPCASSTSPVGYGVADEPAPIAINATNFQDSKLRTILQNKTYDIDRDGSLSADELYQITSLDVTDKGLTTLQGIEYLTNLQYLYAENNDLTSLDVSKNPFLHYLTCYQNRIFDTEMDNLITSLPPLLAKQCYSVNVDNDYYADTGLAYGRFICHKATNSSPWEGNIITTSQLQTAYSKKWDGFVYVNKGGNYEWTSYSSNKPSAPPLEGQLHINQKTFPDSWFRAMVKHGHWENDPGTAFDDNDNDYLSETERNAVKVIWLDDAWYYEEQYPYDKVTSLQGIEYFPNLSELSCINTTGLTAKTDLSRNTKLTYLLLYCNGQVALPSSLQILTLLNKSITSLNLQYQTALTSLDLNAPNLSELGITRCTQLKTLKVSDCILLKSLDVSRNTKLTSFNCSHSGLSSLSLSTLTNLESLNLSYTPVSSLELGNNRNLKTLKCSNCSRLIDLDLTNNSKLQSLDCSNSALMWLTMPSSCTALTDLSIQGNWFSKDQMDNIVEELPTVSSGTRYLNLYDSDVSEQNVCLFNTLRTAVNTKKWSTSFIRHSGSSTSGVKYDLKNIIYAERVINAVSYSPSYLDIYLYNTENVKSLAFDLILPKGITLVKRKNKYQVIGTPIMYSDDITITFAGTDPATEANIYHISASAFREIPVSYGMSSLVMTFEIISIYGGNFYSRVINGNMVVGSNTVYTGPMCAEINVTWRELGDVNNDGKVTPADAIMILYKYFGVDQSTFDATLADLNQDGEVTPADAIEVLYKYFDSTSSSNPAASRKTDKPSATETAIPDPE